MNSITAGWFISIVLRLKFKKKDRKNIIDWFCNMVAPTPILHSCEFIIRCRKAPPQVGKESTAHMRRCCFCSFVRSCGNYLGDTCTTKGCISCSDIIILGRREGCMKWTAVRIHSTNIPTYNVLKLSPPQSTRARFSIIFDLPSYIT